MTRFGLILLLLGSLACNGGEVPPVRPAGSSQAASPGPKPEQAALIELRRGRNPQELVLIGRGGALVGPAGGSLHRILFSSRDRAADLRFFVRRYAPFRMPVPGGELVFRGRGRARAGPVERRMIAEWARLVAVEAGGSRNAAYGLVLAWHRGGSVGICDDISVYLTGEVRASSCSWDEEVRGRLTPEALARVYGAFERLAPFQTGGGEADLGGGTESRLIFAGRGKVEAGEAEIAQIQALAPALFRELAARRPAAAVAPPPQPEGTPSKPTGPPPPVPPRLLLPPDRPAGPTGPKPGAEVALQFPEEPPPVPVAPAPPPPSPGPTQPPPAGEGAPRGARTSPSS